MLVTPAVDAALPHAVFGADEPLDAAGRRAAERAGAHAAAWLRTHAPAYAAPSVRCRQTADALGLAAEPEAELADWDLGRWRGRVLEELAATEGEAVRAWLTDPAAAPHGGESLLQLRGRVGVWLDALTGPAVPPDPADRTGMTDPAGPAVPTGPAWPPAPSAANGTPARHVVAVAEPAAVRAAVVHALDLPSAAFWRLDVPALTGTELTGRAGRWSLRCGVPLTWDSDAERAAGS
ncbi:histidine phosphatase family protein [Streptomyces sp. WMMC500]|uniref:histidine phosphatase family protein n=1 Tax=Streptomyces sp. WMMC500 TaxID=3015154 RepID=UPI00248CB9CB|nr:histidine phosphatase family protein [Streptomyces sp. WMMC500]WBB60099.1 histidine phosphatase family protein [Streptomyces sp. WMMC500]